MCLQPDLIYLDEQKLLQDCRQGQNVTVLAILERLEFKNFSYQRTMMADNTFQCSMALQFEIHFADPDETAKKLI